MKILLDGYKLPRVITFECKQCGCIFEAEKDEVSNTPPLAQQKDGDPPYYCKCPWCNNTVYGDGKTVFTKKI